VPWKELEKDTMEALMKSLLGKDESFVLDRLQDMMKNEEKVKEQEEIIRSLESEVLDSKEETQYLRNKLDQKGDTIDDLEQEIEKIETEVDEIKFDQKNQKNVMENKDRMK
jgi:septal ring factor EnvC (AmiA/AmiB activator)